MTPKKPNARSRTAEGLVLEIASICEAPDRISPRRAERCLRKVNDLRAMLDARRRPPACDLRAAVAFGYASMLARAVAGGDARMARIELAGIYDQLVTRPRSLRAR